jgi:hypothetical protein
MSWITFRDTGTSESGRTKIWTVVEKTDGGGSVGTVQWYAPWRKYSFVPAAGTVFEQQCLRDIAAFCENATLEHRNRKGP